MSKLQDNFSETVLVIRFLEIFVVLNIIVHFFLEMPSSWD